MRVRMSYCVPILALAAAVALLLVALVPGGHARGQEPTVVDQGLATSDAPNGNGQRIVVRYRDNVPPGQAKRLEDETGVRGRRVYPRSGLTVLELPPQANPQAALARLKRSPLVEQAAIDQVATIAGAPNDPGYTKQWNLWNSDNGIRAESAWDIAPAQGAGVVVAIIDTGLAYESFSESGPFVTNTYAPAPDLAGVPIVAPHDFVAEDSHANDDNGHGTHVAGTIAQATGNGVGMAGIAHRVSLMPLKVLNSAGSGFNSDVVEALYYAVDNGADVINMSLAYSNTGQADANGVVCTSLPGLNDALQYANDHGVVVVAAAGNAGSPFVSCPAAYPTVIAVGATRYDGEVTYYSNVGSALDVTAPGGDPFVDQDGDGATDGILQQTFCSSAAVLSQSGDYTQFCDVLKSGTSMASPHVAGISALLLGENSSLSPAQVRYYLETTARDRGVAGQDTVYGWGIVDAFAAVNALKGGPPPTSTPTPTATPTPTVPAAPAAPTGLAVSLTAPTTAQLTWIDNASNEQYYRVERATDGATFSQVALLGPNTTTWSNFNLDLATTYTYRVRASTGADYSNYSNAVTVTTESPPGAPSGLVATPLSATSIQLTWTDNASTEQYYRVERSADDGVSFTQVAMLSANTISWTNNYLQPATTYTYRVRASQGNTYTDYSNVVSVATNGPPAAPSGLSAQLIGPADIQLTWVDNSTDEQYVRVERSTDGVNFAQMATLSANTTTWTNRYLDPGTAYTYRVRVSQGSLYSDYSAPVTISTDPPPPPPANLAAVALSSMSVQLTWTDTTTNEQYVRVERSSDGVNFIQVAMLAANTTTWTNNYLEPSTTYTYRVRVNVDRLYSDYSAPVTVTTNPPPAAPTGLTAERISSSTVRLTWTDNASDEQYYRVERSTDGVNFSQVATLSANTTTWTNYGAYTGTTYHYRVRASVSSYYSDYSNVATIAP